VLQDVVSVYVADLGCNEHLNNETKQKYTMLLL
jgi:hypothetical protein